MPDIRHRPTWDGRIGDADIWLLENMVWRAHYFHAKITTSMTALPALNRFNASNSTYVVDLVEIVLAGDTPSLAHDGKPDL